LPGQVGEALAAWGETPAQTMAIPFGCSREEAARWLRSTNKGHVLAAISTARALDVFGLPFPADRADAVLVLFDEGGGLSQVLVFYAPRLLETVPQPTDLAHLLLEAAQQPGQTREEHGLRDCACRAGGVTYDAALAPHNATFG